jgi:hypothetical protein
MTDEMAKRLLHATREQLHDEPTREVQPFEIAHSGFHSCCAGAR